MVLNRKILINKIRTASAAMLAALAVSGCSTDVRYEFDEPDFEVDVKFELEDMTFQADGSIPGLTTQYYSIGCYPTFSPAYYKFDYPEWVTSKIDYPELVTPADNIENGIWKSISRGYLRLSVGARPNSSEESREGTLTITVTNKDMRDDDYYWKYPYEDEMPVYEFSRSVKITQQGVAPQPD